ncbi:(deoxy)nucleoside triphosphate pyrophosphohydrolase [Actinomyces minihominis]|uniref:(deoxy)nucleoside triphosphate pyrophosphohydrolase n=1 Tax=Actinomyces minihominis TaxID=2002838 RepID=UPI000C086464|nr:(deoxy)nucleoside triphosphate pyrophosphohydrolase [Actinomyces minihominis]
MATDKGTREAVQVVGAVIIRDGKILCAQRSAQMDHSGLWEFPGGKVEAGESPREALRRELVEELRCVAEVGEQLESTTHRYDFATITLTTFFCRLVEGEPRLTEHSEIRWMTPETLDVLPWAPADVPAVRKLQHTLVSTR